MDIPTGAIPTTGQSAAFPGSAFSEYCGNATTVPYYSYPDYQLDPSLNTYNLGQPQVSQTGLNPLMSDTLAATPWPAYSGLANTGHHNVPNLTLSGSAHSHNAPKRKRKTTPTQRLAANNRERRRMCNLNTAFDRNSVPSRRRAERSAHRNRQARTWCGSCRTVSPAPGPPACCR